MVDPVVNSKFGSRPLLEVPALNVENSPAHLEINSLQDRQPQMIKYQQGLNATSLPLQGQLGDTVPTLAPAGMLPMPVPIHMYAPPMNAQYVGVPPMNLQAPPYNVVDPSGNPVPAPSQLPIANPAFPVAPPQGFYPASYNPPVAAPPAVVAPPPPVENFVIEGQLHYGRLATLHFRDGNANSFRGLPEFLRMELQNTYGGFPMTEIRVVAQGGAYHVYATPRRRGEKEEDEFLYGAMDGRSVYSTTTYGGGARQRRMIGGFNRIVGHTAPDAQD